jgi:glyoxylase-like metal-dependent hydrolase (beta-lactamase superfamily II)
VSTTVDPWFAREDVGDGVWKVWEPFVDPFARCNVWVVPGRDAVVVVDTGLGVARLSDAGHGLFDRDAIAVATHYHFDHTGSLHEFGTRLAHRNAAEYLGDSAAIGGALRRADFDADALASFTAAGYELPDDMLLALPRADYDVSAWRVEPCPPTRLLDEGDVVDLGDRTFEVLHLPGHSPDSIGLFDRANGILFSGDAVYDGPLIDANDDSDRDAYVATMERLRALPARVVHGGHEPSFGGARLVELCDEYLARQLQR